MLRYPIEGNIKFTQSNKTKTTWFVASQTTAPAHFLTSILQRNVAYHGFTTKTCLIQATNTSAVLNGRHGIVIFRISDDGLNVFSRRGCPRHMCQCTSFPSGGRSRLVYKKHQHAQASEIADFWWCGIAFIDRAVQRDLTTHAIRSK